MADSNSIPHPPSLNGKASKSLNEMTEDEFRKHLMAVGRQAAKDCATKRKPFPAEPEDDSEEARREWEEARKERDELEAAWARLVSSIDNCYVDEDAEFSNFSEIQDKPRKGEKKAQTMRVGKPVGQIAQELRLILRNRYPRRIGNLLFSHDDGETRILSGTDDLLAFIGGLLKKPIRWGTGADTVSQSVFHRYLCQTVESYDSVESLPHEPQLPRHFYLYPLLKGGEGWHLDRLIDRFCPATPTDRSLIHAMFLTLFWGGEPGTRPAFLIESDDEGNDGGRGSGKSTLARAAAEVAGGYIDIRSNEDFGRIMSRLLTSEVLTKRAAMLDNVKTLRFSWADLEGLITNEVINGHRYYVGDARRPNTLTWFITLNNASLSKDLAQRSVIVRLTRPKYDPDWQSETWAYIREYRWEIIGDIVAQLRAGGPALTGCSRWGSWEKDVLACVNNPAACQEAIRLRQQVVDGDQEESDIVRSAFLQVLQQRKHDPEKDVVFFPSAQAAKIVNAAMGENRPTQRASAHLATLSIRELRKSNDTKGGRGWRWTGKDSKPNQPAVPLADIVEQLLDSLNQNRASPPTAFPEG